MKKVASQGDYNLFKNNDGLYELFYHKTFVGYVSDPLNLSTAVYEAEEEFKYLLAEVR